MFRHLYHLHFRYVCFFICWFVLSSSLSLSHCFLNVCSCACFGNLHSSNEIYPQLYGFFFFCFLLLLPFLAPPSFFLSFPSFVFLFLPFSLYLLFSYIYHGNIELVLYTSLALYFRPSRPCVFVL